MALSEDQYKEFIAYEAFIRRAAALDLPFMLKGSYVTRQYFANPENRIPNDLDWVYLERLDNTDVATNVFNKWMIQVSEGEGNDGVQFRSFRENAFWRMIEYAMDEDFPTVNTDLDCKVDGESIYPLGIDVSFNLPVDVPPVELVYTPVCGNAFTIPFTAPLALQVSWKLHQTLVRLRFKDLFDLMHLVVHPSFTSEVLHAAMVALQNECAMDGTDPARLRYLLNGDWGLLTFHIPLDELWTSWRHEEEYVRYPTVWEDRAVNITDVSKLPERLADFKEQVLATFRKAGFYEIALPGKPESTSQDEKPGNDMPQVAFWPGTTPISQENVPSQQQGFLKRLFRRWYGS